jgi:hypothetical protein
MPIPRWYSAFPSRSRSETDFSVQWCPPQANLWRAPFVQGVLLVLTPLFQRITRQGLTASSPRPADMACGAADTANGAFDMITGIQGDEATC